MQRPCMHLSKAPATANHFLARLDAVKSSLPVAVLGFGDRSFPCFRQFAEDVAGALRTKGWPILLKLRLIERQSAQDFARRGTELAGAIATELALNHIATRPKTLAPELPKFRLPLPSYPLLRPRLTPAVASGGGCTNPAYRGLRRATWLASCRRIAIYRGFIRLRPPTATAWSRSACGSIRAASVRVFCTGSNRWAGSRSFSARIPHSVRPAARRH
jgi:hypothetical protein